MATSPWGREGRGSDEVIPRAISPQTQCPHVAKVSAAGDVVPEPSVRRACTVPGMDMSG